MWSDSPKLAVREMYMIPVTLIQSILLTVAPVPSEPPAPYLAMREGTTLTYEFSSGGGRTLVVSSVARKKDGTYVVQEEIRDKEKVPFVTWCVREEGLYLVDSRVGKYTVELCELKLPIKVGVQWTSKSTLKARDSGFELDASKAFKVVSFEKIKTPAGEFETLYLESEGRAAGGSGPGKSWYAKGIGVVKTETSTFITNAKKPIVQTMTLKSISIPKNSDR
jgi:hypothetical protein